VLFRYERELEPPAAAEGFSAVEPVAFRREPDSSSTKRALVVWLDGVLWRSRSGARAPRTPDDLELVPGRTEILRRHASEGFELLGLSWQPELEAGGTSPAAVAMCCAALGDQLGLPISVSYCPHGAGPPRCWCRKPLPGLGVELVHRHRLDPARCVYVGESRLDRTFAKRLGFVYQDAAAFFRGEPRSG
jgi:histidinol phosphatase-like enzyme